MGRQRTPVYMIGRGPRQPAVAHSNPKLTGFFRAHQTLTRDADNPGVLEVECDSRAVCPRRVIGAPAPEGSQRCGLGQAMGRRGFPAGTSGGGP